MCAHTRAYPPPGARGPRRVRRRQGEQEHLCSRRGRARERVPLGQGRDRRGDPWAASRKHESSLGLQGSRTTAVFLHAFYKHAPRKLAYTHHACTRTHSHSHTAGKIEKIPLPSRVCDSQRAVANNPRDLADDLGEIDRALEHLPGVRLEREADELHRRANVEGAPGVFKARPARGKKKRRKARKKKHP